MIINTLNTNNYHGYNLNNSQQNNLENKAGINNSASQDLSASNVQRKGFEKVSDEPCQTCANRKYVDGSNDLGVSFKAAGHISPESAAATVRSHEQEHVGNRRAEAMREGKEVVRQSVQLNTAVCPECGKTYVSGGKTTTVTASKNQYSDKGSFIDQYA